MLLNAIETGSGDRVALLLHGMMGSAESWWRIAPLLADNGFRVIALDLPGHGLSPRDERCTVASVADDVVETLAARAPGARIQAIGHSYGGTVLAAVAERMPIERAVFVDTTCAFEGGEDHAALAARYEADRLKRTDPAWLLASRPFYSETDARNEACAAERFDPMTAASISTGDDVAHEPAPGSILVRARPSSFVPDETAERLAARGVDVRDIPGAAHSVWYSHFEEFRAALPEFFVLS
ncbi:alpha/beta hydrolase [Microbacterium sp. H1-D42]|uniref:alpha/beta fold hydrolase n=1 Tax=Microbacterium sp. H1-D42 TaxID=2925844 RepID=UPI001F53B19E|nr:alpha/beta hydrolase [Microbacterium sp. H1-D42]UNK69587.1 alpha/beta fold hydrolase [Microbacterium sp. H1-D42]